MAEDSEPENSDEVDIIIDDHRVVQKMPKSVANADSLESLTQIDLVLSLDRMVLFLLMK
jgi:hypothetical protein